MSHICLSEYQAQTLVKDVEHVVLKLHDVYGWNWIRTRDKLVISRILSNKCGNPYRKTLMERERASLVSVDR